MEIIEEQAIWLLFLIDGTLGDQVKLYEGWLMLQCTNFKDLTRISKKRYIFPNTNTSSQVSVNYYPLHYYFTTPL